MKAARRAEIESRLDRLGEKLAEMEADRATFIRHQQTLGRHLRRCLNDNKALRIENRALKGHKRVLLDYVIKTAVAK